MLLEDYKYTHTIPPTYKTNVHSICMCVFLYSLHYKKTYIILSWAQERAGEKEHSADQKRECQKWQAMLCSCYYYCSCICGRESNRNCALELKTMRVRGTTDKIATLLLTVVFLLLLASAI